MTTLPDNVTSPKSSPEDDTVWGGCATIKVGGLAGGVGL